MTELAVVANRRLLGTVTRSPGGGLSFAYEAAWRRDSDAFPLSLSMPLRAEPFPRAAVEPWLAGLLPDDEDVLRAWGVRFQVSRRNVFGLLGEVGEDCAGAVQFVRAERLDRVLGSAPPPVQWLTTDEVGRRLADIRFDPALSRRPEDPGRFSLPGVQPKTALLFDEGRWGLPAGATPTTHILKPENPRFPGLVENEHLCLRLARAAGLPAATTRMERFGDQLALVVTRYDRRRVGSQWVRLHQEDFCQALGVPPERKYQNEGGPTVRNMLDLVRSESSSPDEDVRTLARAIMLNWILAATDSHAKNFSLLIGPAGQVRLAPLYDIASFFPYSEEPRRLKLSNRVGGEYRLYDVGRREWERFRTENDLDWDTVSACRELAQSVLAALPKAVSEAGQDAGDRRIIEELAERLAKRAEAVLLWLRDRQPPVRRGSRLSGAQK